MKVLKLSVVAILFVSLFITSCKKENICISGQGAITTRTLSVSSFTGIDLAGASNIVLSQGPVQEVKATGHPNIIDRVNTNVSGNVWDITLIDGCYENYELSFQITVPNIEDIDLSGSGNISVNDFIDQGDLEINIGGSGNINLNTFNGTENLSIVISGSGHIEGNAGFADLKMLDINISGSGKYNGFPIETDQCDISIPGSGSCSVYVRDALNVNISGSGNVLYKGNPVITSNITGSGSIIDAN